MIYIPTPGTDACVHLAAEYYFSFERPFPEQALLLWQTEPTIVVGRYQNTLAEINLPYVQANGIRVVRRLSGGGAIYSDRGNWMYSFLTEGAGSIDFRAGVGPVIEALQALGVPVEFGGRNDIILEGRKISGTAQYQRQGRTVHHGTLLFDSNVDHMIAATTVDPQKLESKGIASVRSRVVNLKDYLPQYTVERFRDAMLTQLHRGGSVYTPTEADLARIEAIADEKFRGWENVYGRDPRCTLEKSKRFPGGRVTLQLSLKGNRITEAALLGDFFADEAADHIAEALVGCVLDRAAVEAALQPYDGALYGISASDLAALATE